MISRDDVFGTLSTDEIEKTLTLCYLADKSEYTDDERHIFHECRHLIEQGKSGEELAQHFSYRKDSPQPPFPIESKPEVKPKKSAKSKEPESQGKSIIELKSMASECLDTKISLSQTLQLIEACGLTEKDEYTSQECDRFFGLIKNQGQPIDLKSSISNTTTASEAGLAYLIDKITDNLANKAPGFVNQMYLQKVADKLAQSQDEIRDFYVQLEETIMAELSGKKSPLEAMLEARSSKNLLPHSLMKSAESPRESENDTTTS